MKFRLPKLNLLIKVDKENETAVNNFIFVKNKTAIAFSPSAAFCVDLREYLKRELDFMDTETIEEMDVILDYFEGKAFTTEFWKELTSTCFLSLKNELVIEYNSYEKTLNYEDPQILPTELESKLNLLKTVLTRPSGTTDKICFNGLIVSDIHKVFGSELKVDDLIFDFSGRAGTLLFQGRRKDYIFGSAAINYEESLDLTSFLSVKDFAETL